MYSVILWYTPRLRSLCTVEPVLRDHCNVMGDPAVLKEHAFLKGGPYSSTTEPVTRVPQAVLIDPIFRSNGVVFQDGLLYVM